MKNSLIILVASISLLFMPLAGTVHPQSEEGTAPSVAQGLVREGDFAMKLAEALKLGTVSSEAEAEGALATAGIAPRNGWIADYPMTPDILGELQDAAGDAADSGRLTMKREEAVNTLQALAGEMGLPVVSDVRGGEMPEEPAGNYSQYTDPAVINNYYYDEGPPVVTYYPPPWDYYYMYSWVPYPFWWHSFWFPGFFILHDFHKVIIVKNFGTKICTNHVFDHRLKRVVTVDHKSRISGRTFQGRRDISHARNFNSPEAQKGARSIIERSHERSRAGNTAARVRDQKPSSGNIGSSRSRGQPEERVFTNRGRGPETSSGRGRDSLRGTETDRKFERGRTETGSIDMGGRSFNRPDASNNRGRMSFDRPSGSVRSGSNTGIRDGGRSFRSFSGSGGAFNRPSTSGSQRGMSFQRPSPRMDRSFSAPSRSFSAPSMRAPSAGGGGFGQGFRGGGGSNFGGRGGFAGGGHSRGGCRGRC
jgi:hypothetical protein